MASTKNEIWGEFEALMDADPALPEEIFHQFMVKYPLLIPVWRPYDNIVLSKFQFGNQHVADFAFARWDTTGLRWHFIEIERPYDKQFSRTGDPSSRLRHALRQITDWDIWFKENHSYIRQSCPFSERIPLRGLASPHFTIILGRRVNVREDQKPSLERLGYKYGEIMSFDRLQEYMANPWLSERDNPICCKSFSNGKFRDLSSMTFAEYP